MTLALFLWSRAFCVFWRLWGFCLWPFGPRGAPFFLLLSLLRLRSWPARASFHWAVSNHKIEVNGCGFERSWAWTGSTWSTWSAWSAWSAGAEGTGSAWPLWWGGSPWNEECHARSFFVDMHQYLWCLSADFSANANHAQSLTRTLSVPKHSKTEKKNIKEPRWNLRPHFTSYRHVPSHFAISNGCPEQTGSGWCWRWGIR